MYLDQCRQSVDVLSPPRAVRAAEQPAVPRLFKEKGDGFSSGERQEGGVCRGRVGAPVLASLCLRPIPRWSWNDWAEGRGLR